MEDLLQKKLRVVQEVVVARGLVQIWHFLYEDRLRWDTWRGGYHLEMYACWATDRVALSVGSKYRLPLSVGARLSIRFQDGAWKIHQAQRESWTQPLVDLLDSLPTPDLTDGCYSEPVAREALGMVCSFFAKLPTDAA